MVASPSAVGPVVHVLVRVLLTFAALDVILVIVFRGKWRPGIDAVRQFNKAVLNPAMLRMAGSKHWYAPVVHHLGRMSGKPYSTPVVIEESRGHFYIPLPYGDRVDWCANVLAAGGCAVQRKGRRYQTTEPAIVPFDEVAPIISPRIRRSLEHYDVDSCLRLRVINGHPEHVR